MAHYSDRLQPVVSTIAKLETVGRERRYLVGEAGPFALVQVYADGFDKLTPRERLLAYHLAEAGIAGDPIYYDQIADYGLELKQLLEGIWTHPDGIDAHALAKIRRLHAARLDPARQLQSRQLAKISPRVHPRRIAGRRPPRPR